MASESRSLPLQRSSVIEAHKLIKPHVHHTPVLTSCTIDRLASTPQTPSALKGTPWEGQTPANPRFRVFFKCENFQRIGAFKARGAFHALIRLVQEKGIEQVRKTGVVTYSSGNHAQALALAAKTFNIPAHIVMPTISTPSKIEGTKAQGAHVYLSGSTQQEREAVAEKVIQETGGAVLVPPFNHPDIILGQGTMALELQSQAEELLKDGKGLDAIIAPCGGGGMLSGVATAMLGTGIKVFGAEPSFQGADDAKRGVEAKKRVEVVKSLTIADGLRTNLKEWTWGVISDPEKVAGIYAVTEDNIKDAMRLVLERMKCFVEPSAVVGLATILYDEDFRKRVEKEAGERGWDIGVVFSGGNTTIEAITQIFAPTGEAEGQRAEGTVGEDGKHNVENIAG